MTVQDQTSFLKAQRTRNAAEARYWADIERRRQLGLNIEMVEDKRRGQLYSDLWFEQNRTASSEKKDHIGILYLSTFLGLGQEECRAFAAGDKRIIELIRLRHACFGWHKVSDEYTKELFQRLLTPYYEPELVAFLAQGEPTQAHYRAFWHGLGETLSGVNTVSDITFLTHARMAGPRLLMKQLTGLEDYNPGPQSILLNQLNQDLR